MIVCLCICIVFIEAYLSIELCLMIQKQQGDNATLWVGERHILHLGDDAKQRNASTSVANELLKRLPASTSIGLMVAILKFLRPTMVFPY